MVSRKNVKWNLSKNREMRIVIEKEKGFYQTQVLLSTTLEGRINVFYFSDESIPHDCLGKEVQVKKVQK